MSSRGQPRRGGVVIDAVLLFERRRAHVRAADLELLLHPAELAAFRTLAMHLSSFNSPNLVGRLDTLAKWFHCWCPERATDLVLEEIEQARAEAASRR